MPDFWILFNSLNIEYESFSLKEFITLKNVSEGISPNTFSVSWKVIFLSEKAMTCSKVLNASLKLPVAFRAIAISDSSSASINSTSRILAN